MDDSTPLVHPLATLAGAALPDGGEGGVSEFRRGFAYVKGILLARIGRSMEARQVVLVGLRTFPGEADLMRLGAVLEIG